MYNTTYTSQFLTSKCAVMISIKNKEKEACSVMLVDMNGYVQYETSIEPNNNLELDLHSLFAGIYTLIFETTTTSFTQQIVKY